ncbi:hypothetical protein D3C87_1576940 [compost metagenome]
MGQCQYHQVLHVLEVVLGVDGHRGVVIAPDVQPGLRCQARRAGQQGHLGETVGTLAGCGGEAGVADRDRLADQVGGHACRRRNDQVVKRATRGAVGAVQPQRQAGVGQRPVVLLAQAGCRFDIGVGQVQLQPLGTQGLQLFGDLAAQASDEGFATGLGITPEQVDDFFHSDKDPRFSEWVSWPVSTSR